MPETAPPAPVAIRRADYRPPSHLIDTVDLRFELDPGNHYGPLAHDRAPQPGSMATRRPR